MICLFYISTFTITVHHHSIIIVFILFCNNVDYVVVNEILKGFWVQYGNASWISNIYKCLSQAFTPLFLFFFYPYSSHYSFLIFSSSSLRPSSFIVSLFFFFLLFSFSKYSHYYFCILLSFFFLFSIFTLCDVDSRCMTFSSREHLSASFWVPIKTNFH